METDVSETTDDGHSSPDGNGQVDIGALVSGYHQRAAELEAAGEVSSAASVRALARTVEDEWWKDYFERSRDKYRSDLREWEAAMAHYRAWQLENVRGVFGFAQAGLKGIMLVNAGAIVALLAFLGNVWDKGVQGGPFISAMLLFALGLFLTVLAAALSYYTQLLYSGVDEAIQAQGETVHRVTGAVALLSLLLFAAGVGQSIAAFHAQPALHEPTMPRANHVNQKSAPTAAAPTAPSSAAAAGDSSANTSAMKPEPAPSR